MTIPSHEAQWCLRTVNRGFAYSLRTSAAKDSVEDVLILSATVIIHSVHPPNLWRDDSLLPKP